MGNSQWSLIFKRFNYNIIAPFAIHLCVWGVTGDWVGFPHTHCTTYTFRKIDLVHCFSQCSLFVFSLRRILF